MSVENQHMEFKTQEFRIWGYREVKLTNQIALREEIEMDAGFWEEVYPKMDI
jgi:hypothetical protein